MSFFDHLGELRQRLLITFGAVIGVFIFTFNYSEELLKFLMFPMEKELVLAFKSPVVSFVSKNLKNISLVFLQPAEAFWMHLKIAMMAAVVIAMPVALAQVWLFVSPGLLPNERKFALPFVVSGCVLFLMGAAFCFFVILPFALGFLLTYKTQSLTAMISIGSYVDFNIKFLLAFGLVFELPIVILFLTRFGFVTPEKLARSRKYAAVCAFIISGILTPTPDAFNQMLMAVPMIVLYEIGIIASKIIFPKSKEIAVVQGDAQ
ncbi:MAG: twin-arginine translocase subunit TatC [Magnetococcales bacterium]|uniref:Sec-independent protein translocase protein TatC n=2 Tax=Candidatus Magnetobacterium casense TaxID=1455061 RepID=A0ABS6S135_9BACT|nr:twin-arginine translocase subunit TatC [Nitrospirota bacterium]MBV6342352.1 twin-arginine translocase subunit TatC [Candidatus Magnetobacterium casensis]